MIVLTGILGFVAVVAVLVGAAGCVFTRVKTIKTKKKVKIAEKALPIPAGTTVPGTLTVPAEEIEVEVEASPGVLEVLVGVASGFVLLIGLAIIFYLSYVSVMAEYTKANPPAAEVKNPPAAPITTSKKPFDEQFPGWDAKDYIDLSSDGITLKKPAPQGFKLLVSEKGKSWSPIIKKGLTTLDQLEWASAPKRVQVYFTARSAMDPSDLDSSIQFVELAKVDPPTKK